MKVLLLSQFFSTTKGGGEYVFSIIGKMLADENNKIWVITNEIKHEKYPSNKNIKIIFVPPEIEYYGGLPTKFSDNLRYSINTIKKGFSIIKKEKIDIIHSNNFAPAFAGSILSSLTGIPHVTTIHDVFSLCGNNYWKLWGKQSNVSRFNVMLGPFFEKMLIRLKHNAIHAVSEATKDDLLKFGAKKTIYTIPNSIELVSCENVQTNTLQFIFVGRLVFYKNLEVIIKAIKIIKESHSDIKFVIVGDGPHKENLQALVKKLDLRDNIDFKGFLSANEKTKLIATSHALLFPSLCEGFGLVILEAFAQNKPVIVSDVRPLSDIVTHNKNGLIVPAHDENEWAKAIANFVENPVNSEKMGLIGRETLEKQYHLTQMKEKIIQMYNDVLKM